MIEAPFLPDIVSSKAAFSHIAPNKFFPIIGYADRLHLMYPLLNKLFCPSAGLAGLTVLAIGRRVPSVSEPLAGFTGYTRLLVVPTWCLDCLMVPFNITLVAYVEEVLGPTHFDKLSCDGWIDTYRI